MFISKTARILAAALLAALVGTMVPAAMIAVGCPAAPSVFSGTVLCFWIVLELVG